MQPPAPPSQKGIMELARTLCLSARPTSQFSLSNGALELAGPFCLAASFNSSQSNMSAPCVAYLKVRWSWLGRSSRPPGPRRRPGPRLQLLPPPPQPRAPLGQPQTPCWQPAWAPAAACWTQLAGAGSTPQSQRSRPRCSGSSFGSLLGAPAAALGAAGRSATRTLWARLSSIACPQRVSSRSQPRLQQP